MSIFYITAPDGDIFELDATLDVSVSRPGSITSYKVEDGSNRADNNVVENVRVSISGIISDIKSSRSLPERNKDTHTWITGLVKLQESKQRFSFTWRDDTRGNGFTERLDGMAFTNFSHRQTPENGYSQTAGKHSYAINISLEQSRSSSRSVITVEPIDDIKDLVASKKSGRGSTSSFEDGALNEKGLPLGYTTGYWESIFSPNADAIDTTVPE